ncbi:hypothetical protein D8S40_07565 [Salmonella enterica subsp. enterica serovar Enteritidis]|nr:hypothetical protein [Salmonella enterica subsp. enterica serovar Enteritidis]
MRPLGDQFALNVRRRGLTTIFMGNLRHETWHRRPFSCADANVLLLLNLPPNQALNHKAEFTITLAYD